jgi:tetratricopeptide (TPR) repeat protein
MRSVPGAFHVPQEGRITGRVSRLFVKPPHFAARFFGAAVVVSLIGVVVIVLQVSPLRAAINSLTQEFFDIVSLIQNRSPADPEVYRKANKTLQQSKEEGDQFSSATALIQLHRSASHNADHLQGYEFAKQIAFLPLPILDAGFRAWAHTLEAESLFLLGEPLEGYNQAKQGTLHYEPSQQKRFIGSVGVDAKVVSLAYAALTQWLLGYPDQAVDAATEAIAWAQQINHPYSLAFALNIRAIIYQFRGDAKQSLSDADEAIHLSSNAFYRAMGTVLQGAALVEEEGAEKGITRILEGLRLRPPKGRIAQTYFQALLADAYGKAVTPEKGIAELQTAQENVEATEERFFEAEINRLHGELLRQARASDQEAEQYFLKALDIARTQGAKSLELRAATSLVHLWQRQGKQEEARELLVGIYGWFTEGFDTADLQEAKDLLAKLS